MAIDYKVTLTGNDNLTKTLENVKNSLDGVSSKSQQLDEIKGKFQAIENSSKPLKSQLRQMQTLLSEMNFKGLTDTSVFTEIAQKAGAIKDAIGDAAEATKAYASDTSNLAAVASGFQGITGATTILTGAMGMLGVENENVQQAILKVQSALAILNGVQAIANVLNKDSALMLKLKQLALTSNTTATTTNTIATKTNTIAQVAQTTATNAQKNATIAATTAQKAFNLVAKANPYVLLGMAIIGVVGAFSAFAIKAKEATEEEKRAKAEAEDLQKANERLAEHQSNVTEKVVDTTSEYLRLRAEWMALKSEGEKIEWINANKSAFDKLGLAINTTTDAGFVFRKNANGIISALTKIAVAAENASFYARELAAALRGEDSVKGGKYYKSATAGKVYNSSSFSRDELQKAGLTNEDYSIKQEWGFTDKNNTITFSETGAKKYNEYQKAEARKRNQEYRKNVIEPLQNKLDASQSDKVAAQTELSEATGGRTKTSGGSSGRGSGGRGGRGSGGKNTPKTTPKTTPTKPTPTKQEPTYVAGSLTDLEKQLSDVNKKLEDGTISVEQFKEKRDDLLEKINSKRQELGLEKIPTTLMKLREELALIQDANKDGIFINNTFEADKKRIAELTKSIENEEIKLGIRPVIEDGSENAINAQISKLEEKKGNLKIGSEAYKNVQQEITNLQAQLNEFEQGSLADLQQQATILQNVLQNKNLSDAERKTINEKLQKINDTIFKIENGGENSNTYKQAKFDELSQQGQTIKTQYEIGLIGYDEALSKIKKINEEIISLGLQPITIELETSTLDNAKQAIENVGGALTAIGSAFTAVGTESVAAIAEIVNATMQMVAQVVPMIMKLIAVKQGEAMAEGASGAAKLPYPANIGAIASIVAVVASTFATIFAAAKKFEHGGVVGGSSYHGDKILARLNSGEGVLTKKGMGNLSKLAANNQSSNGGSVTFKVKGADLYATLKNFGNIKHKSIFK